MLVIILFIRNKYAGRGEERETTIESTVQETRGGQASSDLVLQIQYMVFVHALPIAITSRCPLFAYLLFIVRKTLHPCSAVQVNSA